MHVSDHKQGARAKTVMFNLALSVGKAPNTMRPVFVFNTPPAGKALLTPALQPLISQPGRLPKHIFDLIHREVATALGKSSVLQQAGGRLISRIETLRN